MLSAGSTVTVTGIAKTSPDGERYVEAWSAIVAGSTAAIRPLGMTNAAVGGGGWDYDPGTHAGQAGIAGGVGANNIGLLVRVFGKVTHAAPDHFYIDDGSGLSDGSASAGIRVALYGAPPPEQGALVRINAISACHKPDGQIRRLLRYAGGLTARPFVAYNDVVWNSSQPIMPNVTTYGIGSGFTGATSGPLVDYFSGSILPVACALTQSGGVIWQPDPVTGGSGANVGTDSDNVFGGIVSLSGLVYYGASGWWVDVEFSGLDPAQTYEFVTTSNRNDSGYANRISMYTISGADSFTNTSTSGVTITNGGASTSFSTGYNTVNGYVARWTNIAPGTDGRFKVRAEVGAGGDAVKAYAFDAFKLSQVQ